MQIVIMRRASYEPYFQLSEEALEWLQDHGVTDEDSLRNYEQGRVPRHDNLLVQCVKALEQKASFSGDRLLVVDIPYGPYQIFYDECQSEVVITPDTTRWISPSGAWDKTTPFDYGFSVPALYTH